MPHSLRAQIKTLCYKGMLTEKERDRIINALDIADSAESNKWILIKTKPLNGYEKNVIPTGNICMIARCQTMAKRYL